MESSCYHNYIIYQINNQITIRYFLCSHLVCKLLISSTNVYQLPLISPTCASLQLAFLTPTCWSTPIIISLNCVSTPLINPTCVSIPLISPTCVSTPLISQNCLSTPLFDFLQIACQLPYFSILFFNFSYFPNFSTPLFLTLVCQLLVFPQIVC